MRISRRLTALVSLGLAACALTGTAATANASASAAPASGTVYTLTNAASRKLMDVSDGSKAPGAPIIQWEPNNGANQEWLLTQTSSGTYTVMSANSGLCLDTPDPSNSKPPVQLIQNPCSGDSRQQWKIQPVGDGTYTLANAANGLLADNAKWSTTQGTAIIQWKSNGGANQHWILSPLTRVGTYTAGLMSKGPSFTDKSIRMVAHTTVAGSLVRVRLSNLYGDGPLTIDAVDLAQQSSTPGTNVHSGMLVDVQHASPNDGTPIIQWPAKDGGTNQQWKLVPTDGGYVKIVSVLSEKKVIGVDADSTHDHAAIVLQTDKNSASQQWMLTPV